MAGHPPPAPVPPLLQLPPLQIPPPQQQGGPAGQAQVVVMRMMQPARQPTSRAGELMEAVNFKVLADMQGRSACVTLLRPNGPWTELPYEFTDSVFHATQGLRVHELILKCHQLKSLPGNFGQLNSLCLLDLSFNDLERVPEVLGQIHQLRQLRLQHNHITSVPTTLGQRLGNLKVLSLQHNKLTTLPSGLCSCVSLQVLNVQGNRIESFSEDFAKLVNLKQLHASSNALEFLPAGLCTLGNLEELYLSNNNIQQINNEIANLQSLKQLHLGNNKLQFLPPCVATMQHLEGLTLTGNPMRFPPLSACRGGIRAMQHYMLTTLKDSVVEYSEGDCLINNIYYTGPDYELPTGKTSPFENID